MGEHRERWGPRQERLSWTRGKASCQECEGLVIEGPEVGEAFVTEAAAKAKVRR